MIIAAFSPGQTCVTVRGLWQWDYGQKLRIQGLDLPSAVEIQFSLQKTGGETTPRIGVTKDGVTDVVIPDSMLENEGATQDYYVYAFVYLTDETSGQTVKMIIIEVKARSKPEGRTGDDTTTMAEILKVVNEIADEKGVSDEKISEAVNAYLEEHPLDEVDPTVPDWAKQPEKPSYTAEEVGALPAGTKIPQSASDVGADVSGTAENKVSAHNVSTDAHNDIRLLVQGLAERLNALADSDDETLDQMSEVVAYIKSNKSLIDAITTGKVSVSDIVDNLTTNVSNKPLSAAQGVALKNLIGAITVPTKLSELENDSGYAKTTDIPDKLPNPQKLTFAGAVVAEYDGSGAVTVTIPEGSGGSGVTARIEKESTDTSVEISANKLYIFPEMAELSITLAEPTDTSIVSEYHFVFQSGATATSLSIPDTVNIPSGFTVDANKIYEISIMEGCLCAQSWEVTA